MCGRYTLSSPSDLVADLFELPSPPQLAARFNIAPTQEAPIVRVDDEDGQRRLEPLRWGLVPFWSKDVSIGQRLINARAETVAEKPSFRNSLKRRRCLVVADGFYEWQPVGGRKQPFYFRRADAAPFAMAGLWDRWDKGEDAALETFTILTTEPNQLVAEVHRRMPVILHPADFARWLDPALDMADDLAELTAPFPADEMEGYPVSTFVNNPANDTPRCIEPLSPS
jgi:putative SOS response-associated peptidase YedK